MKCVSFSKVDWTSESECFDMLLRELAYFYIPVPSLIPLPAADEDRGEDRDQRQEQLKAERRQIQRILFPAMRRYLLAPKSLLDRVVLQVADLPELHKVFERC